MFLVLILTHNARKQKKISAELSAALDEAQKANDTKQNFFSKMSHDIRTPLNVVLGMTQIAQKYKNDTPRLESALDNITSEGSYLLVLINSILDVNQLEHGHVELLHDAFSPADALESCAGIMRPLADKKEQQLTVQYPATACVVVGDSGRYSQIMINIISNAIKYTPVGGHIQVTLEALPDNHFRFTCADNGIGMTEDFVAHITEDYARAEDSRVSKVQGTGLGMSVVKGFTDLMNGTLTIQSKLGEGSTFTVSLDLCYTIFRWNTDQHVDMIRACFCLNNFHSFLLTQFSQDYSYISSDLSIYRHPTVFGSQYYVILTSPCCVLQTCNIFFHLKRPPGIFLVQLADHTFIIPEGLFTI